MALRAGFFPATVIESAYGTPAVKEPVFVCYANSSVPVPLYDSSTRDNQIVNPLLSDSLGKISFYTEPGNYDLVLKSAQRISIVIDPVDDELVFGVTSVNTHTGDVVLTYSDVDAEQAGVAASLVATEAATRASADTTLQSNIDELETDLGEEATARASADTTLQSNIDELETDLGEEVTRAEAAESTLTTNLSSEVTRAEAAEAGKLDNTGGGHEVVHTVATAGTSQTVNLANGSVHYITLDQASCTINFSGMTNGVSCSCTVFLVQGNASARLVTWDSAVKWTTATAPTLSVGINKVDVLTFVSIDGGTKVFGFLAGPDMR